MAVAAAHRSIPYMTKSKEDQSIRVEDYLNDKLQDSADLASIDILLEDVRKQQVLLREQVGQALTAKQKLEP